jgi:6-methylsalicylate decarboxylase
VARIDVHAHYVLPDYREALIANGQAQPDGFPVIPPWSVETHLAMMDQLGIGTAVLSVSSPGVVHLPNRAEWARRVNEAGADAVRQHPRRFGLFATLPLPDVDAALAEVAYAFDTLHADGVVVFSNYDGVYLGDARFAPVLQELNRRRAVTYMHPTSPACWEATSLGYPRPVTEFLFDTTRAVSDMVLNGTFRTYPDAPFIVSHTGAALVPLADRLAGVAAALPLGGRAPGEIDVIATLQRLHYEVGAGYPFPRQLPALLTLVGPEQMLYGTDWPFGGLPNIQATTATLDSTPLLKRRELRALLRDNALELFPRLRE